VLSTTFPLANPAHSPSNPNVDYAYLRQLVFEQSQNVLDPSRDYLFDTRLAKLLRNHGMTRLEELIKHLRSRRDLSLEYAVAQAMTINETSFFRDIRLFDQLRTELLPTLIDSRRNNRTLRIWSAASSTGQEAYSIAMLLLEHFPSLAGWNLRIDGTDISNEVVRRCQSGTYQRIEINRGLPARNIVRFFDHHGEDWTMKPEVKKLCVFRQANLCANPFPVAGQYDIVFLRNVMLYFSQETRKTLLANIHRLLTADGLLFLGSSEQPADPTIWTSTLANGTCYYRPRKPS
jgi:chemotaxis protein methyltransferase CheR